MPRRTRQVEGVLTASDLLNEGSFNEWQQTLSAAFVFMSRPELAYPSTARIASPSGRIVYYDDEFLDNECVTDRISSALHERIRYRFGLTVGELYVELEKPCTPFKLTELTPLVCIRIFKQVIKEWKSSGFCLKKEIWVIEPSNWVPAVLRVNRQLRQEVLELYFVNTTICLNSSDAERQESSAGVLGLPSQSSAVAT